MTADELRESVALAIFGPGGLSGGSRKVHLNVADAAISAVMDSQKQSVVKTDDNRHPVPFEHYPELTEEQLAEIKKLAGAPAEDDPDWVVVEDAFSDLWKPTESWNENFLTTTDAPGSDTILEDTEAHGPVYAAVVEVWGPRCPDFEPGCFCCQAWQEFDRMVKQ